MLGLNLAKPLEFTSWLRTLPITTATTPEKRPDVATTSPPSTSLTPPQIYLWESLDTCLQKNGAMEPFHTLFDQSLLDIGAAEPLQMPFPSDRITPHFEGYDAKSTMQTPDPADCVLKGAKQGVDHLTTPRCEQTPSFTATPSLLIDQDGMVPFCASFPDHLLFDQIEDKPYTSNDTVQVVEPRSLCTLVARPLSQGSQLPFHATLGTTFTSTETPDLGPTNTITFSKEHGGRTSPLLSTISGESSFSVPDSPISSRRSSWATSISTHLGEDDIDQSNFDFAKPAAESDQTPDEIEIIDQYEHYCELIELGDPQNRRDRNFQPQTPVEDGGNDAATPETATEAVGDLEVALAVEASEDITTDDPKVPPMPAGSDTREERIQSESMQPESVQPDTQPDLDSESKSTPPSTPAEAAAWAHSYCDADPESTKLKVLMDDRGKEYVLYHDCFHCVPIELSPEFMGMSQDEDDGYGSETETCEAGGDGAKLGTIPEEENEG